MEKGHKFNALEICRYGLTPSRNDGTQVTNYGSYTIQTASPPTWELVMQTTYSELCNELKKHFGVEGGEDAHTGSLQSYRNHVSTLNSFLASVGKVLDSRVGVELGSKFESALKHYLEIIQVSLRAKRDRRNHLRLILRLHGGLVNRDKKQDKAVTSLSLELRSAIAKTGMTSKALAKHVCVSPSALQRWLKGASPNRRGIPTLRRLETVLELPRDHLVNLLKDDVASARVTPATNPYRAKLRQLTQDRYLLPEAELTPEFKEEWHALFNYKTSIHPMLERRTRGKWRCIPLNTSKRLSPLVQRGNTVSPTAAMNLVRIRGFFGVILMRPASEGGVLSESGKPTPQTLAWLAYPAALNAYLEFMTQRSDGLIHRGQQVFCRFVAALLRPKTGYLWQSHQLASRLPENCRPATPDAWRQLCEQGHKVMDAWMQQSIGISRDPVLPISSLLQLKQPLEPILKAISLIEQTAASAPPGSISEALLRRDALLLSMFLSNPLRLRTFISMSWLPDGTGMLRGNAVSGWRINLENHHLKNGTGQGNRAYDVGVAKWITSRLEAYLEEYRPTLLGGRESCRLFVSSRSADRWEAMGSHIRKLTERYIADCPGFGAHAFRHLVASAWLAQHPNDFLTVAELLNDKLDTVMAHYAHLKRDTSFQRYEEHLNATMLERP